MGLEEAWEILSEVAEGGAMKEPAKCKGCRRNLDGEEDYARRAGGGYCGDCLDAQDAKPKSWEHSER